MKKPCVLNKKDTIGIVAPASSFDKEIFKKGISFLRGLGYKVVYERRMFSKYWSMDGYAKERAEQINRMFENTQVKAILCAKAGYGSFDIIPYINEESVKKNPKIFVGYSDITALLLYLQYVSNMVIFHGPVVSGELFEGVREGTVHSLFELIGSVSPFGNMQNESFVWLNEGSAKAHLVGGNISLIMQSLGKKWELSTDNKILFLEEVAEPLELIKESLMILKKQGKFDTIKGVIFGNMIQCGEGDSQLYGIISEVFGEYNIPLLYGFPSGHVENPQQLHMTIPFGVDVEMNSQKKCVHILESAVS